MSASLLPGAEHFQVTELPAYEPSGAGEHLFVTFEKTGLTTPFAADVIARACGRTERDVGHAGMKDRHAITVQTISIAHGDPTMLEAQPTLLDGQIRIRHISRHGNKLKPGHLRGNRFRLGLALTDDHDRTALATHLARMARDGLGNRYGDQRFGIDGANLIIAKAVANRDWVLAFERLIDPTAAWNAASPTEPPHADRSAQRLLKPFRTPDGWKPMTNRAVKQVLRQRPRPAWKLIVNAAQAAIFNAVFDHRNSTGTLHQPEPGDIAVSPKGAPFVVSDADQEDVRRRAAPGVLEVFVSGPLPGHAMERQTGAMSGTEEAWSAGVGVPWSEFNQGLFKAPGTRRPLVVPLTEAPNLEADPERPGRWWLTFALPPGAYATTLLEQCAVSIPADRGEDDGRADEPAQSNRDPS